MKFLNLFAAVLAIFIFVSSCKKGSVDKPPVTSNSITGTWEGKFGTDNNNPSSFFSFNIKEGGILEELTVTGQVKGTGTWKLENKILSGYTINVLAPVGNKYSILGAYNSSDGKILGNWGYGNSPTDGGLWEMTKKN